MEIVCPTISEKLITLYSLFLRAHRAAANRKLAQTLGESVSRSSILERATAINLHEVMRNSDHGERLSRSEHR